MVADEGKPKEKRRIRKRVLKSKTFMNDEGYMGKKYFKLGLKFLYFSLYFARTLSMMMQSLLICASAEHLSQAQNVALEISADTFHPNLHLTIN